jgi:tetratricopeptide (TPR) repeat protein
VEESQTTAEWTWSNLGRNLMNVLISGQTAAMAIMGKKPELHWLGSSAAVAVPEISIRRIFSDCTDIEQYSVTSIDAARTLLRESWSQDRALRLFLMTIDPLESDEDLREYSSCLETLLLEAKVFEFVERSLFIAPFPTKIEIGRTKAFLSNSSLDLFNDLISHQTAIKRVADALHAIPTEVFGDALARFKFIEAAQTLGANRDLAKALKKNENIDFLIMKLIGALRHLDGSRKALEVWTSSMRVKRAALQVKDIRVEIEDPDYDDSLVYAGKGGREVYENVRAQQAAIVELLKERNLDEARRYADELIKSQKGHSSNEQIAKSLSYLAQQAKLQGVPELQREWAEQATEVNPHDPKTSGHLADALIGSNRFQEAYEALDRVEAAGDRLYAENGRARILRLTGRLEEARAKYLAAAAEFEHDPSISHSLGGAADILRDMGRYEDARKEYENLAEMAPQEASYWSGLASVLMDLGKFADAIKVFGKAAANRSDPIPRNGRATAYKHAGNFDRALQIYDEVIADYPNDPASRSGRAEVLRAKGNLEEALEAYDVAIERSPFTAIPISGKVEVLKELGRYQEAAIVLQGAVERFPYDGNLASGYAGILKRQGRYPEALALYEQNALKFPFNIFSWLNRADIFARMGRLQDSLKAYDEIVTKRPDLDSAWQGKAAVLIRLKEFSAAEKLLPVVNPQSQVDWNRMLLRAVLLDAQGKAAQSQKILELGYKKVPFAKQRRMIKAALARMELIKGHASQALKIIEAVPNEISNVIRFHALAASGRRKPAAESYQSIIASEVGSEFADLANEIASHFQISSSKPKHSRQWIFEAEREAFLVAA